MTDVNSFQVRDPMRLAEFIRTNREPILDEWEAFARTCAPASGTMDKAKSKGNAPAGPRTPDTAAEEHGAGRAESGFTVAQMVAEYRALRASVIRLWTRSTGERRAEQVEDLTRFNEAIDQSLAESVSRYRTDLEQAKELFLAILGHDLRLPLGAIFTSATFMLETGELGEPHRTLMARIAASARRTVSMVGDLLDFTRGRLGGGIPAVRAETNLGKIVHDVVEEISAAHPGRHITVQARGEQRGSWDAARLAQALGNLVGNAVQHGSEGDTVTVEVRGGGIL